MSSQSPSNSSISTDQEAGSGSNPAAAFGPNEWLVDEIYQQYLQDPNSVDRAWWDFFADYKPGTSGTADKPVPAPAGAVPAGPRREHREQHRTGADRGAGPGRAPRRSGQARGGRSGGSREGTGRAREGGGPGPRQGGRTGRGPRSAPST